VFNFTLEEAEACNKNAGELGNFFLQIKSKNAQIEAQTEV